MSSATDDASDRLSGIRSQLSSIRASRDRLGFLARVASLITEAFVSLGLSPPVVVGGLAVETYTSAEYTTRDIDFIHADDAAVRRVMSALGFITRPGYRYYEHTDIGVFVEFPTGPLDGDRDRIAEVQLDDGSVLYVIGVEDAILDRVAAYVHWDKRRPDSPDAAQAVTLLIARRDMIDTEYLNRAAKDKGLTDALRELEHRADTMRQGD